MKYFEREVGDTYEEEYMEDGEIKIRKVEVTDKYTDDNGNIHVISQPVK